MDEGESERKGCKDRARKDNRYVKKEREKENERERVRETEGRGRRDRGRNEMREAKRSRKDKAAQNVPLRHLKSFFSVENLSFCKRRRAEK